MNKFLPFFFLAITLGSCKKDGDGPTPNVLPAPSLVGGTWTFQSEVITTTPKSGGAATTSATSLPAGILALVFVDATRLTSSASAAGQAQSASGTYTYSAKMLTISYPTAGTQIFNVSELSASKLVLTVDSEDTNNRYVTTETFIR